MPAYGSRLIGGTLTSRLLPVALSTLPQIDRLVLATVTTVPEWHPERDTFEPFRFMLG